MNIRRPNETALDVFKRHERSLQGFTLRSYQVGQGQRNDHILIGESVEIQAAANDVPIAVLDIILQFCEQFPEGIVIHVSTNNSLVKGLSQSSFDVTNSSLNMYYHDNRLKCLCVTNIVELLACYQYLSNVTTTKVTLVIMEGLNTVILPEKEQVNSSSKSSSIVLEGIISGIKAMRNCVHMWTLPSIGGIKPREKHSSWKDVFSKSICFSY